jgi:hypothetical protein
MHQLFRPLAVAPIDVSAISPAAQRQLLEEKGYLSLSGVYDISEIETLWERFARLLDGAADVPESYILELATGKGSGGGREDYDTMQVNWIDRVVPQLLESSVLRRTQRMAESLLGGPARLSFGSLINKSPAVAGFTPWHQDAAYDEPDLLQPGGPGALGFWIPLVPTGIDNGCLCYAEGSHRGGLRPHARLPGEHSLVATLDEESESFVACPVPLGGVALHHRMTLHCALPNRSSQPRPVFTINFVTT